MLQPDSIASSLRWMLWYVAAQVTWRGTPWRSPPRLQQEPPIELPARPAVFDPDAEPLNILCMDGGGIRGRNLMVMVEEIEAVIGRPVAECFDLVAGTSIGGCGALLISQFPGHGEASPEPEPQPEPQPQLSP